MLKVPCFRDDNKIAYMYDENQIQAYLSEVYDLSR
jgi:hypothetical protein